MKAILEFNLPEEKEDFEIANNANARSRQIEEILSLLRTLEKYGGVGNVTVESLSKQGIVSFIRNEALRIFSSD